MKTAPMKKVIANQNRRPATSPRSAANTPSWQVTLDSTRMIVNGAAVFRSRWTSGGGQLGSLTDRTVKYMANSAAKNISSLDSHTIVPTLTTLGLMRDPCDGTFSRAEADATEGILAGRPARRRHDPPVVRRHLPWGRVTPPGSRVRRPAGADALVGAGRLGARPAGRRGAR